MTRLPFGRLGRLAKGLASGRYSLDQIRSVLGTMRKLADGEAYLREHESMATQSYLEHGPV